MCNEQTLHTEICLPRDNRQPLSFTGKLVVEVSSDPGGQLNRWTELKLYVTETGTFIAQCLGKSCLPNEGDLSRCEVFKKIKDLPPFYRFKGKDTWLSRKMGDEIKQRFPEYGSAVERVL